MKKKNRSLLIGGLAMFGTGVITLIFATLIVSSVMDKFFTGDYERTREFGTQTTGTVVGLQNTRDAQQPVVVTYVYNSDSSTIKQDVFFALSTDEAARLQMNDKIPVKFLDEKSIVTSLEPFKYSSLALYGTTLPFIIVGLVCLVIVFVGSSKEISLYQHGVVVDADVVAVTAQSGRPVTRFTKILKVHYQYHFGNPEQHYTGVSVVTDAALVAALTMGMQVKIFVSPDAPSSSVVIPLGAVDQNDWQIGESIRSKSL